MRIKLLGNRLALIAIFALCFSFVDVAEAVEEVQTVEADGYYLIGDGPDENHSVAKDRARMDAKRMAAEKAGVLVESMSEIKGNELTADEARTISSQVLRIQSEKIIPEVQGETIRYRCHIVAIVSTKDITEKMLQDKEKLYKAVQKNKQQEKELAAVQAELAALKKKYQVANTAARQVINRQVKKNETRFTITKLLEKAEEHHGRGEYDQAIECYNKAINLDPNYVVSWYDFGRFYTSLGYSGRYDAEETSKKALKYYRKAIEVDAKYAPAWSELGQTYNFFSDHKKSLKCYQKAAELEPENGYNWYALGGVYYYDMHDYNNAVVAYRRAVEAFGKAPERTFKESESWDFLGWAYYEMGNYRDALDAFSKAKELEPNHIPYKQDYQKALKALG